MGKPPYADTRFAAYLKKRVLELRSKKSQLDIANEAGFNNPNVIAIMKAGRSKLPLDRVPSMAKALECDPKMLFRMAIEQDGNETLNAAITEIFGTVVSRNEIVWIDAIRQASDNADPALTSRARSALMAIFGK